MAKNMEDIGWKVCLCVCRVQEDNVIEQVLK